jgi:hypothetical protein
MYEVSKDSREIDGIEVTTWTTEIFRANVLEVEVGTNGYRGGDSGHGSRTYVRIQDLGSTDMRVRALDVDHCAGLEVLLGGDCELVTFIESLEFILKALKEGIEES